MLPYIFSGVTYEPCRSLSSYRRSAVFIGFTIASVGGQQAQPAAGGVFTAAQAQAGEAGVRATVRGVSRRRFSRRRRRASARRCRLPHEMGPPRDQRAIHLSRADDAADESGRAWRARDTERHRVSSADQSSADFQHGPIAMVEGGFPILAIAPKGKVQDTMREMLTRLRKQQDAELVVISDDADALSLAQSPIQLPPQIPEWLTPLVSILPAQLFACHLTRVKGYDTEKPRSITKVTETH